MAATATAVYQEESSPDNKEKDESKGAKPEESEDQPPGDAVNEEDEESVAEKPMGVDVRENKSKEEEGDDKEGDDEDDEAGDEGQHESEPQGWLVLRSIHPSIDPTLYSSIHQP